ncbi:unnamed protein product [Sphagnum tenellum]
MSLLFCQSPHPVSSFTTLSRHHHHHHHLLPLWSGQTGHDLRRVQRNGKPQQNAVTVNCNLHFQRVVKDSCSLVNSVWPLPFKEEVSVFGLRVRKQPSLSTSVCLPHLPTGLYCVRRSSGCKINGRQQVHSLASAPELHSLKMGVQECLQNIYSSMGLQDWALHEHITVSGTQTLMGMEGEWYLNWNMDGRFFEQFDGIEMTMEWAYDGEDEPWGGDAAGRITIMDLDDREVCLLTSWIRTGFWVTQRGQQQLHIELEKGDGTGIVHALSSELILSVKLLDSKVVAYVIIDKISWLPIRSSIRAFGGWDNWEYSNWQLLQRGRKCLFPFASVHRPPAGGRDIYSVQKIVVTSDAGPGKRALCSMYSMPNTLLVPRHNPSYPCAEMDSTCLPFVEMIQAESGHYLVRPLIDGRDIGYFIVDTGASSLTIAPEKAMELGMHVFGEVYVTGAEGEVRTRFCRAKSFQLGPLKISAPLFMEVSMEGVVRGVSSVAGICGYDIFHNCIVEMEYRKGRLSLHNPLTYKSSYPGVLNWHMMRMLENVPHVSATFNGHSALFLLDTGAGGVDVIFHGRAVEEFDLMSTVEPVGSARVKGISSSSGGIQVKFGILDTLELGGQSFQQVRALFSAKDTALDLSEYTAGVVCGDLLAEYLVILDYGSRKLALVDIHEVMET